jgi:hypothetical protein
MLKDWNHRCLKLGIKEEKLHFTKADVDLVQRESLNEVVKKRSEQVVLKELEVARKRRDALIGELKRKTKENLGLFYQDQKISFEQLKSLNKSLDSGVLAFNEVMQENGNGKLVIGKDELNDVKRNCLNEFIEKLVREKVLEIKNQEIQAEKIKMNKDYNLGERPKASNVAVMGSPKLTH